MSTIPTCAVFSTVRDSVGGEPLANATVTAKLSSYEIYEGFVVPSEVIAKTDELGFFTIDLFPNELGSASSFYEIKVIAPNGKTLRTVAVVPNLVTVDLADISELPPYEGKPDGAVVLAAAIEAKTATEAWRNEAEGFATEAALQAGIATQRATDAEAQAAISIAKAQEAADSAGAAAISEANAAETLEGALTKDAAAAPDGANKVGYDGGFNFALGTIGRVVKDLANGIIDLGFRAGNAVHIDSFGGDMKAAVDSLSIFGGKIVFGRGTYVSAYQGKQFEQPQTLTKPNVTFEGAGKPSFNDTFTKLEGGTIIQGSLFFAASATAFYSLGFDAGKDYCDAANGGIPMEGLVGLDRANAAVPGFEGGDPPKYGFIAHNIAILAHGTGANGNVSDVHALLLENYIGWSIRNITQVMGGAGLVIKSSRGTMDGAYCRGSFKYGVLNKSEAYSPASFNTYNNIVIEGLYNKDPVPNVLTDYDTAGFLIEAVGVAAENITVTGLICNGPINGIQLFSDFAFPVRNCTFTGFSVRKAYGYGAFFGNGYVEGCSLIGGTVVDCYRGIYGGPATTKNNSVIGCTVSGSTHYNYSNAASSGLKLVSCISYNPGIAHFGNTGGTTEFIGGFSTDASKPQVGGSGGTITGLAGVDLGSLGFSTTPTGQPATLTGPTSGAMAVGDYTSLAGRLRNTSGGGVSAGDSIGAEIRFVQPGTGNQGNMEAWTRFTSSVMMWSWTSDYLGAFYQKAPDTVPVLSVQRSMSFYWISNFALGVKYLGTDGVTRQGAIAMENTYSATFDWPSLATGAQQSTTATVTGAALGDFVEVSMSTPLLGARLWAEVTAANTVTVYQRNDTGASIDLASGTLRVRVKKPT